MNGLYLLDGNKIVTGDKTAIPAPMECGLAGMHLLLLKDNTKYTISGIVSVGPPSQVSLQEFDADIKSHCVAVESRMRWWPKSEKLYLYPVRKYISLNTPISVSMPAGIKMKADIISACNVNLAAVLADGITVGIPIGQEDALS